jgi:type IV pilus assembly protein PilC
MATFNYTATNAQNHTITGSLEAADRSSVIAALAKQNLRPISIKDGSSSKNQFSLNDLLGGNKVKADDIVMFTRQLSAMISAGVPILRALTSLGDHAESPALKKIIGNVVKDVQGGSPLADALGKYPNTFSDVYVNMVRAGEAAGILDDILKRLALQQEKNAAIRKKVKSAMTYPMVLIFITILAFFGLMIFVIPMIGKTIKDLAGPDASLPVITQIMLGISGFMISYWYILLPILIGAVIVLLRYLKTPIGKAQFHHIILKLPGIKTIIRKLAVARFARTFSALMGAGVAVLEALDVTARAIGNTVYEKALKDAAEQVKNGKQLSEIIEADTELWPAIAVSW